LENTELPFKKSKWWACRWMERVGLDFCLSIEFVRLQPSSAEADVPLRGRGEDFPWSNNFTCEPCVSFSPSSRTILCKRYLTIAKPALLPSDSARRIHTTEQDLVINAQHLGLIILRVFAHFGTLWISPSRWLCERWDLRVCR
jgi:hypothetical protein